ncbi:MAG TPA: hypothetical protein VIT20_08755 [Propionibacteriaceae bacterium]
MSITDLPTAPTGERAVPRRRLFRIALGCFRLLATLHALIALTQPLSIGNYLSGLYPWLRVHELVAIVVLLFGLLTGVASIAYALSGGRVWVVPVCALFFFAEGTQIGMGHARILAVHIPLGVLIICTALLIAVWSWTRPAGRPRVKR